MTQESPRKYHPVYYFIIILASASAVASFFMFSSRHWIVGIISLAVTAVFIYLARFYKEKVGKQ
ncbi:hypothetical protein COR50_17270 [Chitinophaga caeni]|uniref:Uncharacterized protein n=1 Tax=Chitinophaga caeni TaxID=2029983 RepID=A0A291QY16_9BACT|nr:hypothetical protein COR50_17270 [Chitinophaga caeni]